MPRSAKREKKGSGVGVTRVDGDGERIESRAATSAKEGWERTEQRMLCKRYDMVSAG